MEYQPLSAVRQDLFNILATSTQYRKEKIRKQRKYVAFKRIKLRTFCVLNGALAKESAFYKVCKFNSQALTDYIHAARGAYSIATGGL